VTSSESIATAGSYTPGSSPHLVGLIAAGPAAAIVGTFFFILGGDQIPIIGAWSMDDRVMFSSLIVAPLAFAYGAWAAWGRNGEDMPWAKTFTRGLAATLGIVSLAMLGMPIIDAAFKNYLFSSFYAAVFPAITSGVVAYVCAAWAARRWPGDLVLLAVAVVGVAVMGAAATAGADDWWTAALSSLGTAGSSSWRLFNVGVIVSGTMLLLTVHTMRPMLERAKRLRLTSDNAPKSMSWGMALAAILLIGVGLFPMDTHFAIHNVCGVGFGAVLLVGMVFAKRLFPGLPKQFIWYSWAFAVLSIVTAPLYPLGIMSLAEIEVVIFGVEALWAMLWLASLNDAGV